MSETEQTIEVENEIYREHELEFSDKSDEQALTSDEIPREQRVLRTQAYDKSISDVVAMIEAGDIVLDPDYQRSYVWDNKKASLLIESILLNVPIPVIYVAEDEDSRWNVVDGLQRLNSLHRFFVNEFKLRGLEVLQELNRTNYENLNPKAARILRNGILRIILIFKESHPEIKYEIFMRLNRGAIKLTDQELRNCLFRGSLNELVKRLRNNPKYLEMIGLVTPHKRMDDVELVLRYFTISDSYNPATGEVQNYTGKVKSSINKFVESNRNPPPAELQRLEHKFNDTIDKVYHVFGKDAFQRMNPDGTFDQRINRGIMDIVMVSFEHTDEQALISHKGEIHALLRDLPAEDTRFNESILIATSDKRQLEYRLRVWSQKLNELLAN